MEEIKRRITVIQLFLTKKCTTSYAETNFETMCLQIRKILELIALGSLVANKNEFTKFNDKFEKLWNAREILRDIKKVNPDFYPKPVNETKSEDPQIGFHLDKVISGYLTEKKFLKIYEKCGGIMHAANPFKNKFDYNYYKINIPFWVTEITTLLNIHLITLVNSREIYIVKMNVKTDGKVHAYTASPVQ